MRKSPHLRAYYAQLLIKVTRAQNPDEIWLERAGWGAAGSSVGKSLT